MFSKCVIIAVLATAVFARSTTTSQNSVQEETPRAQDSYFGDFRYVFKVYQECAVKDLSSCLKLKLVTAMDRAAKAYPLVNLLDGISFVPDPNSVSSDPLKTETEIEATLPRSLSEKDDALNAMIADRIYNFFQTHTLQVKLPSATEMERSFNGEERGKKKKGAGLLLIPLILGGTLIPLALGALALLAGKALIISKLALVLAGIIGLKKLLSGHSGGHESGHEVVVSGGHGSSWGRSLEEKLQAQNLAYSAYAPKQER